MKPTDPNEENKITQQNHHGIGDNIGRDKNIYIQGEKNYPKYLSPNFPKFNPKNFVGRSKTLEKLHELLQSHQKTLLLNGLGGIGKTSVARMYCHLHEKDYEHFVWISQSDEFENAMLNAIGLQQDLGVQLVEKPEQTIRLMFHALNKIEGNNLLVLDNADESLQIYTDALPPSWKILVTSRQKMDERYTECTLGVLDFEEAKKLFQNHFKKAPFTDVELLALCKEIGFHTLTLELLAKTLQESFELQSIGELTQYLQENRLDAEVLQEEVFTQHSKEEVEIYAHLLQVFTLALLEEKEQWLLLQFAVLPPIGHEAKDFLEWIQVEDKRGFGKILKQLHKKGWLERKDASFSMHRMIQTLIRYQIKPRYENCKGLVDTFVGLLQVNQAKDNPVDTFQWIEYGVSLCNCIQVIQEKIGHLNNWVGHCFQNLGNYKQAVNYFQNAISIVEEAGDFIYANSYRNNLGIVYRHWGQYEKAAELLEDTLVLMRNTFGVLHPIYANSQSNLANVYGDMGRNREAAQLLEAALKSDIKNFGKTHPNVAKNQSNLASAYGDMGRSTEAAQLLEAALESDIKNFGKIHPKVVIRQSNLGNTYTNLGRNTEAVQLLKIALESSIKIFGEERLAVAKCQSNLGHFYFNTKKYKKAQHYLEKAFVIFSKSFGIKHFRTQELQETLENVKIALQLQKKGIDFEQFSKAIKNFKTMQKNNDESSLKIWKEK